jgi:hypothetical protein
LTQGEPLVRLLGTGPASRLRCESGGDPAFVPPYDTSLLLDTDFQSGTLIEPAPPTRDRGWRASPIWSAEAGNGFGVKLTDERQLRIGFGLGDGLNVPAIAQGSRAMLAQEIRSARGGHYTFTVRASGGGTNGDFFERVFLANLTCRLLLFRFANMRKDPREAQVLASADFRPAFSDGTTSATYAVDRFLGSTIPGANFPIGNGLGVAVVIEKTSPAPLPLAGPGPHRAFVRIHSVALAFNARPRDDSVTV